MTPELIVCWGITILLGLFQWAVSRLMRKPSTLALREFQEFQAFRMWGIRGLIFALVFFVVLYLRQDDLIFVMIVYILLSAYNSSILKKSVRKIRSLYPPTEVKKVDLPVLTQEILDENPLGYSEEEIREVNSTTSKNIKEK